METTTPSLPSGPTGRGTWAAEACREGPAAPQLRRPRRSRAFLSRLPRATASQAGVLKLGPSPEAAASGITLTERKQQRRHRPQLGSQGAPSQLSKVREEGSSREISCAGGRGLGHAAQGADVTRLT